MSKLQSLYENLKKENNNTIYLFKSGIFYLAIADDAIFLSNKFGFKLSNLNDSIMKCAFPVSSQEKYTQIFNSNNIDFKIIDYSANTMYLPKEYQLNDDILDLISLIKSIDTDKLSISEAYSFIENLKEKTINIKI